VTEVRRRPGAGRRAGESGTREAILDAARREFGARGYDGATIRNIAAAAQVNPALVHHFYGTKEQLFAAAMQLPVLPSQVIGGVLAAERERLGDDFADHIGEALVRGFLGILEIGEARSAFLGLVRSAVTSEQSAAMLREFVTGTILATLAQVARPAGAGPAQVPRPADADPAQPAGEGAGDRTSRYRASLVATQVVGLGFVRYVLQLEPLASASAEDLVAAIGPVVQRYLTGDLDQSG
jgi:AcrR family transcriptional regulator